MGTNSEFGKEFDSLADVVSFGMAPAVSRLRLGSSRHGCCGFARRRCISQNLAGSSDFSSSAVAPGGSRDSIFKGMAPGGNRYFVGMPTPAAAGMIAAVVHAFRNPIDDSRISLLWLAMIAALGILMSSSLRHYSFKDIQWTKRQPSLAIVLWAALIGAVVFLSRPTLLVIATAYTPARHRASGGSFRASPSCFENCVIHAFGPSEFQPRSDCRCVLSSR